MATLNVMSYTGAELDYAIPEIWSRKILKDYMRKSFWAKKIGPSGSSQPIVTRNDFTADAGDTVHIQVLSRSFPAAVTGESTLMGSEAKLALGQFNLSVDWKRMAYAYTKKLKKMTFFEIAMVINSQLSDWLALDTDNDIFYELITTAAAKTSTIYANGKTSLATLTEDDTFSHIEIDKMKLALKRRGTMPIQVKTDGGGIQNYFGYVMSEVDAHNLRQDKWWWDTNIQALDRGMNQPAFTGALGIYNGMILYDYNSIKGVQGTGLRPEAQIYGTHTAIVTTITVGANDKNDYTKNFPSTGYLSIMNTAGTAREFVQYTGKTAYTFTGCTRASTYGGTTSVASTYVTGDLITLYNHVSYQIGFGAETCAHVWSVYPQPIKQTYDYEFEQGLGIECMMGVKAIEDSANKCPNYVLGASYAGNPLVGL